MGRTEQANLTRVWSTCCPNPSSSPEWSSLAVGFFVPNEAGRRGSHPRGLRSSHITWYLYVNQASIPKTYHALFRRDVQTIIQYPRWSHRQVEAHQDYLSRTCEEKDAGHGGRRLASGQYIDESHRYPRGGS